MDMQICIGYDYTDSYIVCIKLATSFIIFEIECTMLMFSDSEYKNQPYSTMLCDSPQIAHYTT